MNSILEMELMKVLRKLDKLLDKLNEIAEQQLKKAQQ